MHHYERIAKELFATARVEPRSPDDSAKAEMMEEYLHWLADDELAVRTLALELETRMKAFFSGSLSGF